MTRHTVWKEQHEQRIKSAGLPIKPELLGLPRDVPGIISSVNISREREMQRVPVRRGPLSCSRRPGVTERGIAYGREPLATASWESSALVKP
jgi:hypothetical protein